MLRVGFLHVKRLIIFIYSHFLIIAFFANVINFILIAAHVLPMNWLWVNIFSILCLLIYKLYTALVDNLIVREADFVPDPELLFALNNMFRRPRMPFVAGFGPRARYPLAPGNRNFLMGNTRTFQRAWRQVFRNAAADPPQFLRGLRARNAGRFANAAEEEEFVMFLLEMIHHRMNYMNQLNGEALWIFMANEGRGEAPAAPPAETGLSSEQIEELPELTLTPSSMETQPSCSICLEEFQTATRVKQLPCGHSFHTPCIGRWLLIKSSCPNCKGAAVAQGDA
eukprot:TRINITY_DN5937_c0_g1_i3.p1 TRINITY_DN5937_c0_g1~~TRINITY_DN5937_c0_g1_i3.p1  ORF type:complete len:282 (+),score=49.22 TRINITY_DN5937_c0_g1_i3:285-1130(+)